MSVELLKRLRGSVVLTALLAGALSISACQQQSETDIDMEHGADTEETVPMSAEPAEPNNIIIDTSDTSVDEVEEGTVISVDEDSDSAVN